MDKIELSIKKLKELYKKYNDKVGLCATDILGFDLCFDTIEKEIKELQEFAIIMSRKFEHFFQEFKQGDIDQYVVSETYFVKGTDKEFDLIRKVVDKYGK